jgi:hypothetical protein
MPFRDKRIPIEQCVNGKLYKLLARNIKIGVYKREPKHPDVATPESSEWFFFYGIRTKFGSRFIDAENHWDAKEFASCCPMEEIGELPAHIDISEARGNTELFEWLEAKEKELGLTDEEFHKWRESIYQADLIERKSNINKG